MAYYFVVVQLQLHKLNVVPQILFIEYMKNIPVRKIKVVQKEANPSEQFSIREVQELLGGNDMDQELHRHDFFYMLALKKGKGKHDIDFTPHTVSDHSLFFMRPGQVHQHTLKAGSTGYLIAFKADFYTPQDTVSSHLLRQAGTTNRYQFDARSFEKVYSLLTDIFQEYTDKKVAYQEVIKANLRIVFIELSRQAVPDSVGGPRSHAQERLEEFVKLVETHIARHKQVSHYADLLNISAYQLNAITKALLGKTASELINEYSVLESKRYLLATANQVNQIAYELGYEDVSYFIRFFKKHTGYSPEAFRQKFK